MTAAAISIVDGALDAYIAAMRQRKVDPYSVRCATLAQIAGVYREDMSTYLQEYRRAQEIPKHGSRRRQTRYVIQARSYGPGATWRIISKPGNDPLIVRRNRRDAHTYAVKDTVKRCATRIVYEVAPATARHNSNVDVAINNLIPMVEQQLMAIATYVESTLSNVQP